MLKEITFYSDLTKKVRQNKYPVFIVRHPIPQNDTLIVHCLVAYLWKKASYYLAMYVVNAYIRKKLLYVSYSSVLFRSHEQMSEQCGPYVVRSVQPL